MVSEPQSTVAPTITTQSVMHRNRLVLNPSKRSLSLSAESLNQVEHHAVCGVVRHDAKLPPGKGNVHESRGMQRRVRFGLFELDEVAGELRSEGNKLKLQDQPFQMLRFLLERHGEIVTREELREKIWAAHTFVDFDHGINNAIKRLRETLGDTA